MDSLLAASLPTWSSDSPLVQHLLTSWRPTLQTSHFDSHIEPMIECATAQCSNYSATVAQLRFSLAHPGGHERYEPFLEVLSWFSCSVREKSQDSRLELPPWWLAYPVRQILDTSPVQRQDNWCKCFGENGDVESMVNEWAKSLSEWRMWSSGCRGCCDENHELSLAKGFVTIYRLLASRLWEHQQENTRGAWHWTIYPYFDCTVFCTIVPYVFAGVTSKMCRVVPFGKLWKPPPRNSKCLLDPWTMQFCFH